MKMTVICGFTFDKNIEETFVSRLLQRNQKIGKISCWRYDCVFTLFSPKVSPHYKYHGIANYCRSYDKWMIEFYQLSEKSQLLLAIATQKWLEAVERKDNPGECPLFEISNDIEHIIAAVTQYNYDDDEWTQAIKKINAHIFEKYGHLYP